MSPPHEYCPLQMYKRPRDTLDTSWDLFSFCTNQAPRAPFRGRVIGHRRWGRGGIGSEFVTLLVSHLLGTLAGTTIRVLV